MHITELNIYPVKSCRGISLSSMAVNQWGPAWDRRFMLVDDNGKFLTARTQPALVRVICGIELGGLSLSAPGQPLLHLTIPDAASTITVQVWGDEVSAWRVSVDADHWFSEYLDISVRLVFMPESSFRQVDQTFYEQEQRVGFADGFPLLMTRTASLDELNSRLDQAVDMRRFRPNIVVSDGEAWVEDDWRQIQVGSIRFKVVKPCSRCVFTTINPDTAEKGREPLKTLASYRRQPLGTIFGQNLVPLDQGVLQIGDKVCVLD